LIGLLLRRGEGKGEKRREGRGEKEGEGRGVRRGKGREKEGRREERREEGRRGGKGRGGEGKGRECLTTFKDAPPLPLRVHQNRCRLPQGSLQRFPRLPSWFQGGCFASGREWREGE